LNSSAAQPFITTTEAPSTTPPTVAEEESTQSPNVSDFDSVTVTRTTHLLHVQYTVIDFPIGELR
jgi:hypothetical protein